MTRLGFDLGLDGKVVVVTGGSRGIGRAIAAAFVSVGSTVRITGRTARDLHVTADELGPACSWTAVHSADEAGARACVASVISELGSLDVLVNNTATNPYFGPLVDLDEPRANKTVAVNQWAPLMWTSLAWKAWQQEHGGAVVNIASLGGLFPWPGAGYYGVTKAAMLHLTRQLSVELAPGVRVNAVAPGLVDTDLSRQTDGEPSTHLARARRGRPAEVADLVVFLASERSSLVTGATLVADAGARYQF